MPLVTNQPGPATRPPFHLGSSDQNLIEVTEPSLRLKYIWSVFPMAHGLHRDLTNTLLGLKSPLQSTDNIGLASWYSFTNKTSLTATQQPFSMNNSTPSLPRWPLHMHEAPQTCSTSHWGLWTPLLYMQPTSNKLRPSLFYLRPYTPQPFFWS